MRRGANSHEFPLKAVHTDAQHIASSIDNSRTDNDVVQTTDSLNSVFSLQAGSTNGSPWLNLTTLIGGLVLPS